MFSMFGSTVLVPLLIGLNPGIALFSSGVGTLLHILITKKQIPAYMGSSFAFIIPMVALMKTTGYPGVATGVISVGIVYLIVAAIVAVIGTNWIEKLLPPIVVGPIMVIGLSLSSSAAQSSTLLNGKYDIRVFAVAMITLGLTIVFNMFLKGFLGLIQSCSESLGDTSSPSCSVWLIWHQLRTPLGSPCQTSTFHSLITSQ